MKRAYCRYLILLSCFILYLSACRQDPLDPEYPVIAREERLPEDIQKRGPETDLHPPVLHSLLFEAPIPVPGGVNTSGAEDSPFVLPDGKTLYFFFTPDVRIPVEKQLLDSLTGVWVSSKEGAGWSEARRVWLQDPGKLSLDGAVCIQGDEMWFASAREGFTGVNNFTASQIGGEWTNWQYSGDRIMKELRVGETHLHGNDLYYHSDLDGGKGDLDIWKTTWENGQWGDPVNLEKVNSEGPDGFPFVSADGKELWLTRTHLGTPAIYRSQLIEAIWSEPELIVSQFAGEPTLDDRGNLYFVHHYFEGGVMIEADIYLATRK